MISSSKFSLESKDYQLQEEIWSGPYFRLFKAQKDGKSYVIKMFDLRYDDLNPYQKEEID
jgi:hypothetical protein